MKRFFSLILISGLALFSFSSENPLEKVIAGFKKYLEELPQEKIYIHFDRPYYSTGETIWFKAYLTAGALHEPSPLSRTLYVELINEKNQLIKQYNFLSTRGFAPGQILLPDSLPSGNYLVRAYTNWMKNSQEEYFFYRNIKIWNSEKSIATNIPEQRTQISFFPEGGNLIVGIRSKVAFKAIGVDGLGREVKGKIVDETGKIITEFKSNFLGMGACTITPQQGSSYYGLIDDSNQKVQLPEAKETGILLSVTNPVNQPDVVIRIQTNDLMKERSIYLIAQTRGIVCFASKINLPVNLAFAKIPKNKFPKGVAQISLLNAESGIPIAERLTYVSGENYPIVTLKTEKEIYKPREKVTLSIAVKDSLGNPVFSKLSLSVLDNQQVLLDENSESINSYLFLSSELRGHIESPNYYFNPTNEERHEALDYLLMTQGWRRYDFKKAQEPSVVLNHKVEQGLTVKGIMVDKFNDKPISDGKVTYFKAGVVPEVKTTQTNSKGYFELSHLVYFDSAQAVLQGETKKGNKWVKFLLDSLVMYDKTNYPIYKLNGSLNDFEKDFIKKSLERKKIEAAYNFNSETILLDGVEVIGKRYNQDEGLTKIYGSGTTTVHVADNPGLENLLHPLQLIQGRIAGVQVSGSGQSWAVTIRGNGSFSGNSTPLILVNNVQVGIDYLNQISVKDIESVDVWKGADAAIFGSQGGNGVIGFYIKQGRSYYPPREGISQINRQGFEIVKEFYMPLYDVSKPEHVKPDRRVTLFWTPTIETDSLGNATVSFYNHDLETTITGVLQGLSSKGEPISRTFNYSIKE